MFCERIIVSLTQCEAIFTLCEVDYDIFAELI